MREAIVSVLGQNAAIAIGWPTEKRYGLRLNQNIDHFTLGFNGISQKVKLANLEWKNTSNH